MRIFAPLIVVLCAQGSLAQAQGKPQSRPGTSEKTIATSDEKAAEIKRLIEAGQARQRATDARNTFIWKRWDYAVCIGCGPMPKTFRIVHTTPSRVLAGFLAANDDQRSMRSSKRAVTTSSWASMRR
ncbi:hypothetical protein [Methylobacterium iners]|uniref:hypothetical protein n=1 Tax=Methylobacterium iners TaxID=418707 RepID=UPI001EE1E995|nr:hypothetical protein [Methylobacterium iners]